LVKDATSLTDVLISFWGQRSWSQQTMT